MGSENASLKQQIGKATKWSGITEIMAKMISPVTNMILARLLAPESFGIVATVTMIFSFADMFTDAGFQKYIVQRQFSDDDELFKYANVAFWANLSISILFWIVIAIFADEIAALVGCEGKGNLFIVSCISLPLTSFSSIQMAIYRRGFDFKRLFHVRLVGSLLPLFVTVPLAYFIRSYWALIIGSICGNFSNVVILTAKSRWKPRLFFRFAMLKEMLSFSIWALVEAVSVWLTNYIGVFIVGTVLSSHYLGIYKTAMTTVNQITSIITSTTTPVLFSALSRMQDDKAEFKRTFMTFQRITSYLVVPLGVGIFLYRELITDILLGDQWAEATGFIGAWGLVSCVKIIYSNYCYEVYRAMARPKLAVIAQALQLVVLVPGIWFAAHKSFEYLYITRSLITLVLLAINQIIMNVACHFSSLEMVRNTYHSFAASGVMCVAALLLQSVSTSVMWSLLSIVLCMLIYCVVLYAAFPRIRSEIRSFARMVIKFKSKAEVKGNEC